MSIESINLGSVDHATIYSDWHLRPSDLLSMSGSILHSRRWNEKPYPQLPYSDIFEPPSQSGSIIIGNGDMFHLSPLFPYQSEIVPDALSYFAEALYKKNVTGETFRFIPGNHTKLKYFPPDVISFLTEKSILVPDGKLSFQSGGEEFLVMHGQEAQPGAYNIPLVGNPKVSRFMDSALHKFRKVFNNGDVAGNYPFPPWVKNLLNKPQKIWQSMYLPPETKLISGHTHVPEVTPNYLNSGFWDVLFGYLSFGKVDRGEMQFRIREI